MKLEEFDRQAAVILASFNFERVAQCMRALNWTWHAAAGNEHVPTVAELRACAEMLLHTFREGDGDAVASATGGLRAECKGGCLSLAFIVERKEGLDAAEQEFRSLAALDQAARSG